MDLIERQAAIDAFDMPLFNIMGRRNAERVIEYLQTVIRRIKDLPSAQPEREKGRWILDQKSGRRICSECLACASRDDFGKEYLSDYCTVCGADMRGGEHATD